MKQSYEKKFDLVRLFLVFTKILDLGKAANLKG